MHREHFGALRLLQFQRRRLALRLVELAEAERRLDQADARLHGHGLGVGVERLTERVEGFAIARLLEQHRAELELKVGVLAVGAPLDTGYQRR
jgi:hypothetical protein